MKNLTQQEKIFVTEYIKSLNGKASARAAGFDEDILSQKSQALLCNENVIKEIKSQIKKQLETLSPSKGYIIQKLLKIAEFSLEEEEILDKEGSPTGKTKLRDTSAALKALEALCKYLGFAKESPEYCEAKIITIANLDDTKI